LGQQVETDLSDLGPNEFAHLAFSDDIKGGAEELDAVPPVVIFPRSPEKGGSLAAAVKSKKFLFHLKVVGQETVKAIAFATQMAAVGWRREAQRVSIAKAVEYETNARSLDRGMDLINQVHPAIVSDIRFGLQNAEKPVIRAVKP
jgi:hypothetical protein